MKNTLDDERSAGKGCWVEGALCLVVFILDETICPKVFTDVENFCVNQWSSCARRSLNL
jgi:hypothetical protein